jgi:hypothetical protein
VVIAVGLLAWLVLNIPTTGRTWPAVKPPWMWLGVVPTAILLYSILNGLLLFWTLVTAIVFLCGAVWLKVWRGLYLRLWAVAFRWKKRPESS